MRDDAALRIIRGLDKMADVIYDVYKKELRASKSASRTKENIAKILSIGVRDEDGHEVFASRDDLIASIMNYKTHCAARNTNRPIDLTYVLDPANFFGRTARFSDFLPRICNEMEKI